MVGRRKHEASSSEKNNTWANHVLEKFQSHNNKTPQPSSCVCIHRVPELLIRLKRKAYRPEFVSFGPFHHNKQQRLSAMEGHKIEAVQKTLERLKHKSESIKSINDLIAEVQKSDEKIRNCYEDSAIEYDAKTLALMMTMDGCFILEFLRAVYAKKKEQKKEEEKSIGCSLIFKNVEVDNIIQSGILNDILKLENQIPLFILINILQLEFQTRDKAVSKLMEILHRCLVFHFYPFKTTEKRIVQTAKNCARNFLLDSGGACHLLDLCREMIENFLTQTSPEEYVPSSCTFLCDSPTHLGNSLSVNGSCGLIEPKMAHVYDIPRAELLHNAGIQFRTCEGNLRFEKRSLASSTLFLPQIVIEEKKTETKLRNLLIFEEYEKLKKKKNVISNYISFMSKLIDSGKDVALLSKEGIIINWPGSDEEVAALFNNLDKETIVGGIEQFVEVAYQVREEYNKKCKRLMRQFRAEHCSKPWYIVSLAAGILILGMTALQTLYSVKMG